MCAVYSDVAFDGYDHESLPDVFYDYSCKNEGSATKPEAVVDIKSDNIWTRLPITEVETRINKDGPADLTSTSRVSCPATWGVNANGGDKIPIYEYVGENDRESEDGEFDLARVMYWNQYSEEYTVESFGYVASIGPSAQNGVFQFYVYDTSDLMSNIPVTETYDGPTAEQVANFVAYDDEYGIDSNGPIPITNVSTTAPQKEREIEGAYESFAKNVNGWLTENVPILKFGRGDDQTVGFREWLDNVLNTGGQKHFVKNRDTLADVMNWLTSEIGGTWYFEPTTEGVVLVVNNGTQDDYKIARTAYYDGQFEPSDLDYIRGYNPASVDVINNSSLEDLKPINHIEVNGETTTSYQRTDDGDVPTTTDEGPVTAVGEHSTVFPRVTVTYPPLLQRTNGRKLGPRPLKVGTSTLAETRQKAVDEFKEKHEDNTDGSIEIKALPSIRPYDYMAAVPVCNDTFNAEMDPIQYEVNSVKHYVKSDEPYITSLGVSLAIDEDQLEITDELVNVDE